MNPSFRLKQRSATFISCIGRRSIKSLGLVFLVVLGSGLARVGWTTKSADAAPEAQRGEESAPALQGAYWSIEEGYEATLTLSNTSNHLLIVWPTLYNSSGQGLEMEELELEPHQPIGIDIGQGLAGRDPAADPSFSSGSLRLVHSGQRGFDLAAQVTMTDVAHSLRLDVPVRFNQAVSPEAQVIPVGGALVATG